MLVVDDHRQMLDTVCTILARDFNVVGVAADGHQALIKAPQLHPDVIVLDVTMPGLDGFQTARALAGSGSRAPIVFLSMHDADEYVTEAFGCGGRAYVVKSRVRRDLPSAVDQALCGRAFVPSTTSLLTLPGNNGHAIQVHGEGASYLDGVAAFFDAALRRGDATCVIAAPSTRQGLNERLRVRGWNVAAPSTHPRYLVIDSTDALNRFMRDGLPDPSRLAEIAAQLDRYRTEAGKGTSPRLTIFGDMVMTLHAADNQPAMIALEREWTTLTRDLPFFTLCGYAASSLSHGACDLRSSVLHEHSVLTHAGDV